MTFLKDLPITMRLATYISMLVAVASLAFAFATERAGGLAQLDSVAATADAAMALANENEEIFQEHEVEQAKQTGEICTKLDNIEKQITEIHSYIFDK